MAGAIFRRDVERATGRTWGEWVVQLGRHVDELWSHEQIKNDIVRQYGVSEEWGEWIAVMYEQLLGRTPVGVTQDAGVQIGVRRTVDAPKEQVWRFLMSPEGLLLWIGNTASFELQKGHEYASSEGVTGKVTVIEPSRKLRLTWKRPEWDRPSRLQITVLSAKSGKTTIAIHQEMLEDVYMREIMRRYWDEMLEVCKSKLEAEG